MSAVTTTKKKSFTTFQMALIAVMAAITCILGPLSIPDSNQPRSDFFNKSGNLPDCMSAWLEVWNNKLSDLSSYWYCRTPCFLRF